MELTRCEVPDTENRRKGLAISNSLKIKTLGVQIYIKYRFRVPKYDIYRIVKFKVTCISQITEIYQTYQDMDSKNLWQRWDSNPRLRRDWCLKPAP